MEIVAAELVDTGMTDEVLDTLADINNLADELCALGDLTGARHYQERALEAFRRLLGPEHPGTLTTMHNLAVTFCFLGDFSAARELQRQVLDSRCRLLGNEDSATTTAAWNLFGSCIRLSDQRAAHTVVATHLAWLLRRDPASLTEPQRQVAALLTKLGDSAGLGRWTG
jgi:hypothetical protein